MKLTIWFRLKRHLSANNIFSGARIHQILSTYRREHFLIASEWRHVTDNNMCAGMASCGPWITRERNVDARIFGAHRYILLSIEMGRELSGAFSFLCRAKPGQVSCSGVAGQF